MSETQKTQNRPLSPHLQVYKLPMTALMSISHRITGVAMAGGFVLIAIFLVASAVGEDYFLLIKDFSTTLTGTAILFAWSLALYYHLCNGIRHMIWDTGKMLDQEQAVLSGWVVLVCAAALTAMTWYLGAIY